MKRVELIPLNYCQTRLRVRDSLLGCREVCSNGFVAVCSFVQTLLSLGKILGWLEASSCFRVAISCQFILRFPLQEGCFHARKKVHKNENHARKEYNRGWWSSLTISPLAGWDPLLPRLSWLFCRKPWSESSLLKITHWRGVIALVKPKQSLKCWINKLSFFFLLRTVKIHKHTDTERSIDRSFTVVRSFKVYATAPAHMLLVPYQWITHFFLFVRGNICLSRSNKQIL